MGSYPLKALPHRRSGGLMAFNDACTEFDELRAVIMKGGSWRRDQQQPPTIRRTRPRHAPAAAAGAVTHRAEERRAPVATAHDPEMEQAAAARERQLLAELEQDRIARIAAGDTRETYILCLEPPCNGQVVKVLAALRDPAKSTHKPESLTVLIGG
jgi:hypothetical protein